MAQPQSGTDTRQGPGSKPSEEGRNVNGATGPLGRAAASALSVREGFRGACVFLTGATGYVGSLVLEQILRVCPEVDRVYVLSRGKKSASARERVDRLLQMGLFHKLWDSPDVLAKVHVIEGDITKEGLSLSMEDSKEVLRNTTILIHSAATVALDDHIQHAVKNNYMATRNVLELCVHMSQLKAYLHVSTAYVGVAHGKGSTVLEKIYPLMDGDQVVDHQEVAYELLRMPEKEAAERCTMYLKRWNMANTYCLSKHLAEQLVVSYHRKPFPVCIVRPSMITGLAGSPYPGYLGNLAGGGGYTIAYALGFFEKNGDAWYPQSVIDIIPGDVVSSVVLAAAASTVKAPLREHEPMIFHATSSTTYPATSYEMYLYAQRFFTANRPPFCLLPFGYPDYPADYVPCPYRLWFAKSCTSVKNRILQFAKWGEFGQVSYRILGAFVPFFKGCKVMRRDGVTSNSSRPGAMVNYHMAYSQLYPEILDGKRLDSITESWLYCWIVGWRILQNPSIKLCKWNRHCNDAYIGLYWSYSDDHRFNIRCQQVHALCYLMRLFGKARAAQRLYTGWKAWAYGNCERHDFDLYFSCANTKALDRALMEDERKDIRCLWTRQTGDWNRYFRTHMAGILKLFLKKDARTDDHDFKFIISRQAPLSTNDDKVAN